MYPKRPQTSLVFALPLLTRRVLLCSVLLRVTERLEQASFVIKRDEKLPSSHLLFRLTLLSMKEILYRFQAFNLFCFVFVFFNFRSHSPLPFFFSRTRVRISIFYVMKIVYLSTFSGMREIRNSSDLSTLN